MLNPLSQKSIIWNGKGLYTRTGHLIPAPANFVQGLPADMCLDGELFIDRGKFEQVSVSPFPPKSDLANPKPVNPKPKP